MTEVSQYHIQSVQGVKLSYVAILGLDKGESQPIVTHNITELMSVKAGRGEFIVDGNVLNVTENDLLVVNPDTMHGEIGFSNGFNVYILGVEN